MTNGWDEVNAISRLALFGMAFAGATACTYMTEDGALPPPMDLELQFDLPEHCEASRTLSGYVVTCDPVPGQEGSTGASTLSEFGVEGAGLGEEDGAASLVTPDVDFCDELLYEGAEWVSIAGSHVTLYALAGTEALTDGPLLLDRHEAAYEVVADAIGLTATPHIDLFVSPNRAAAAERGLDFGFAIPGGGRIEAIYDGAPYAYLKQHPGYLVTQSLLGHVLSAEHYALPVLATGLGEHLDQSGRDLHLAYAYDIVTAADGAVIPGELSEDDVWGNNFSSAGSLVSFMVERHSQAQVMDLIQATAMTWQDEAYYHSDAGYVDTLESLTGLLADMVPAAMGESWEELRAAWQDQVQATLSAPLPEVTGDDRDAIVNLVGVADAALNGDDANAYRAVMDGFYCEDLDDEARLGVASDMTQALAEVETQILRIYPTGTRNYPTARVLATRGQGADGGSTTFYDVERFPAGWRITQTPEW